MSLTFEEVAAIVGAAISALIWLLRLEGRVNLTDARYQEIIGRLERIEDNQDRRSNVRT
jgi:hypothetical protein